MIMIKLLDGATYSGSDFSDLIHQLRSEDWTVYAGNSEYKKNIARRASIYFGESIQYESDEEFFQELQRLGFISEINIISKEGELS